MILTLALVGSLIVGQSKSTGPRFDALVEVYRTGVVELRYRKSGLGTRMIRKTLKADRDATLRTWPNGAYTIESNNHIEIYWGNDRRPKQVGAGIVGWMGKTPILGNDKKTWVLGPKGRAALPTPFENAADVLPLADGSQLVVRRFIKDGSDYTDKRSYSIVNGGVSMPFNEIGDGSAEFRPWRGGILMENEEEIPAIDGVPQPEYGDLWLIGPNGPKVKRVAHRFGVEWQLPDGAQGGDNLVAALGYDSRVRKFHDFATLYRLNADQSMTKLLTLRGEWSFYGLDQTKRWVLATRWQGWEMGAYDLVAVNLKTGKQEEILHAVSDCRLIEP